MVETRTALITGVHGFTGQYMLRELEAAGYRTIGLGVAPSEDSSYRQIDLLDFEALSAVLREIQPDLIVHLAAVAFVGHADPAMFYRVNLIGTRNLLEAIDTMGKAPNRVLLASSANVYGNSSEGALDEGACVAPANDYAVSKLAMELMASLYQRRLPLVIARPFNYTGIGQARDFLVPKIVCHFQQKAPIIELGNLDVWRDFGDVRSVVRAYRLLLECPEAQGQTFNVCSGYAYSLREIIGLCESITGHKIQIRVNPKFVRANEIKKLWGDCGRLRNLLRDWQPLPLERTLQWMLGYDSHRTAERAN